MRGMQLQVPLGMRLIYVNVSRTNWPFVRAIYDVIISVVVV